MHGIARKGGGGAADRSYTSPDQALQFRAAGFHRALAKKKPTQQKSPFWAPPTDRAEGTLSVQIGGYRLPTVASECDAA